MKLATRRFLCLAVVSTALVGAGLAAAAAVTERTASARPAASAKPLRDRAVFSFLHSYEATGRYWRGLE